MRTVLFVCTGNTCRSPMAEGIAQKMFDDGRFPAAVGALFFASAGVAAMEGAPTSEETVDVLERLRAPVPGHAKRLTPDMIRKADLVLGMTNLHVARARAMVAAMASGEAGSNSASGVPTTSGRLEVADATVGAPLCIASRAGSPNPS
jgi:protein-tyrosine-phosphatase